MMDSQVSEALAPLGLMPFVSAVPPLVSRSADAGAEHHAAVNDLVTRLLSVQSLAHARSMAARLIAEHLNADFVAIGENTVSRTPCARPVIAGHRQPSDERRSDIEAALGECALTARPHSTDGKEKKCSDAETSPAGFAHQRLFKRLGTIRSMHSVPLFTCDGRCCGAIMMASAGDDNRAECETFLAAAAIPLAELFAALQRATPGKMAQRWRSIRESFTIQRKRALGGVLAVTTLIAVMPTRYPVRADVSIQPSVRRWVSAPFEACLKKAYVSPGQSVEAGDLLFTVDCEDTLNKLASLRAESERSTSERSAHLSSGRLSEAAIAGWNAKRIGSEMQLLIKHLDRSEIRSPIAGVVLGEDLQRLEGSPLKRGQTLIEVARMDQMHAAIEIPPDQINRVRSGSEVAISVAAAGWLPVMTLHYVHPRAEANEKGRYVFQGRAEFAGNQSQVKPGMRGTATVYGQYRPLAWCLIQRLWQGVREWGQT